MIRRFSGDHIRKPKRPSVGAIYVGVVLALMCAAPTPGDIGGCGQPAETLDAELFFKVLKYTDCSMCQQCGFVSVMCTEACDTNSAPPTAFDKGCEPLAHDGEVCLRKLQNSSCDAYSNYVNDDSPTRPSECQFCPAREP